MTPRIASEALLQLLRDLPARVPPERIDQIWLFRPREIGERESGLVVLSLRPEGDRPEAQRQVVTVRYEAQRVRGSIRRSDSLAEQGWAPAERIPRLIEGVLARLGDESEDPAAHPVEGDPARWAALLAGLAGAPVDPAFQE